VQGQDRISRTIRRLALAAALVALVVSVSACKPSGSTTPTETTGTASTTTTPDVAALSPSMLAQQQEGLLFSYVQAGGIPALETAFGKPTSTYMTDAEGGTGGSLELKDGRTYRFEWGLDAAGKAIVIGHTVEAKTGQTPTAQDKAFVAALVDGKTGLDQANAYLAKVGGASAQKGRVDPKALRVPAHLWNLKDGSGFIVLDLTGLTPEQMKAINMENEGPYQAMYWDASHFRAY
jgi:hypothetical protein